MVPVTRMQFVMGVKPLMFVKRVMLNLAMRATQHLRHCRGNDAQQDREHPEKGPDLLTVAAGHG